MRKLRLANLPQALPNREIPQFTCAAGLPLGQSTSREPSRSSYSGWPGTQIEMEGSASKPAFNRGAEAAFRLIVGFITAEVATSLTKRNVAVSTRDGL